MQEEVAQREATIRRLERDLKESRKNASTSEKNLARFQRKINRLRVALTKEIEKVVSPLPPPPQYCETES